MTIEEILTAALTLPEADRLQLADRIRESVTETGDDDWANDPDLIAVLKQRCENLSNSVPWEEVRQRLHRIVQK